PSGRRTHPLLKPPLDRTPAQRNALREFELSVAFELKRSEQTRKSAFLRAEISENDILPNCSRRNTEVRRSLGSRTHIGDRDACTDHAIARHYQDSHTIRRPLCAS